MISKFTKSIKINKKRYAIFNSLIMQPIFVDKEHYNYITQNNTKNISKEKLETLKANGIFVENKDVDDKILNAFKETYEENIKNKITIMYLIPTNTCNLKCKYCFIGKLNEEQ